MSARSFSFVPAGGFVFTVSSKSTLTAVFVVTVAARPAPNV